MATDCGVFVQNLVVTLTKTEPRIPKIS